jgi:hypothetical protein
VLDEARPANRDVCRAWLLVDQLRAVFDAPSHELDRELLDAWVFAAATSEREPFVRCAITLDQHAEEVRSLPT